jgi:hypothetical protein
VRGLVEGQNFRMITLLIGIAIGAVGGWIGALVMVRDRFEKAKYDPALQRTADLRAAMLGR